MPDSKEFRYGSLIRYHFYKDYGQDRTPRDYWAVGYVIKVTNNHIKLSSLDPNKQRRGIILNFKKKVRIEDIIEFTEIPELPSKKS